MKFNVFDLTLLARPVLSAEVIVYHSPANFLFRKCSIALIGKHNLVAVRKVHEAVTVVTVTVRRL